MSQLYNARGKKLAVAAVQRKESNGSEVSNSAAAAATEKAAKRKSLIGTPKIPDPKHPKQQNPATSKSGKQSDNRRRSSVSAPSAKSYANPVKTAADGGGGKPPLPPPEQSSSKKLFRRIFQRQ